MQLREGEGGGERGGEREERVREREKEREGERESGGKRESKCENVHVHYDIISVYTQHRPMHLCSAVMCRLNI